MRFAWRTGLKGVIALLFVLVGFIVLTARHGDPKLFPAGRDGLEVVFVSNGYHSGLALPRRQVANLGSAKGLPALISIASRFQHYDWVEFGWGDAEFYRATPTPHDFNWRLAWLALTGQGQGSVLHVVGLDEEPERIFAAADVVRIRLSPEGFSRLAQKIEESFATDGDRRPQELGPGLYGPSLFYKASGHFNLFHVCNHWVADLLDAAGVPTTPALSILPAGLLADLTWRSGLKLARTQ
ncbi:DUF2459 domain-containing protein [Microvirga sp. BSC39]|uniref:DUF2459 domain-containing protein n=1 Tax=Microvirga sp. BSC39 TaxID=1549810 RepID=UPI0004E92D1D|nr:DUF2459 domain-containing protein [Microvirga sp. BSC39]KFG68351.1 hypothetical protein JH26_17510 [Microvirga sp. BSC39]